MPKQITDIRPAITIGLLASLAVTLFTFLAYRGAAKRHPENLAAQSATTTGMHIDKAAEVWIGGSGMFTIDLDEHGNSDHFGPMSGEYGEYFKMHAANEKVFVVGAFSNGDKNGRIDGKSVRYPPGWDFNSDEDGFEVVDEDGIPVLQLIAVDKSRIYLNGCFTTFRDDSVVLNPDIIVINPGGGVKQYLAKLKPIFRHPGKEFPQQRTTFPQKASNSASVPTSPQ